MNSDGFVLPNVFSERKTPAPEIRTKSGKIKKQKRERDVFKNMSRDSIMQSRGMGIDQPRRDLGIMTFDQNMQNQPNPLNFGLKIDAGFPQPQVQPQQQRNPLNVGLQVGNLGIDSFNTKDSLFSGREIDRGIGATPVPRSALGGAANLGGDFITQVTGKRKGVRVGGTGFGGDGEDDFLKVAGRSFGGGAPRIVGREPTVAGARASARASIQRIPQSNDIRDLNVLGGLESLAGGIGRASSQFRQKDKKGKLTSTGKIAQSGIVKKLKERASREDTDINPFNIYNKRRFNKRQEKAGEDEFIDKTDQTLQNEEDEFIAETSREERFKSARQEYESDLDREEMKRQRAEQIKREIAKRQLTQRQQPMALGDFDPTARPTPARAPQSKPEIIRPTVTAGKRIKQLPARLDQLKPFSSDFDQDGDGDIDTIGRIPTGVFGTVVRSNVPSRKVRFGEDIGLSTKPDSGAFGSKKEMSEFMVDSRTGEPLTLEREQQILQAKADRQERLRLAEKAKKKTKKSKRSK